MVDLELFLAYMPRLLKGAGVTLQIVGISTLVGAVISIPVAAALRSKSRLTRWVSTFYINLFRGTPLLIQTFLIYYGVGSFRPELQQVNLWWFFREPFYCVLLAFTLNTSAYQARILSGAIASVSKGQWEAACALGLSRAVIMWKVILPQALVVATRPYMNEVILLIKASAIASVVTIFDLMGETRLGYSRTFNFEIYLWAALIYLVMVEAVRRIGLRIETRLQAHLVR